MNSSLVATTGNIQIPIFALILVSWIKTYGIH